VELRAASVVYHHDIGTGPDSFLFTLHNLRSLPNPGESGVYRGSLTVLRLDFLKRASLDP
jgi:hypothetical protein